MGPGTVAAVSGWAAVPLLFAGPMTWVLAVVLAAVGGVLGTFVLTTTGGGRGRLLGAVGAAGALAAVALVVVPFALQD